MRRFTKTRLWIGALLFCALAKGFSLAQQGRVYLKTGVGQPPFDVTQHSIPLDEILSGGPPKDGVPALNAPKFVSSAEGDKFLKKRDRVLAIEYNGVAKAYPIRILNWHEIVNDEFDGKPVVVSWCPLCLSGIVYDPETGGKKLTFGVSGQLYKSNLLMYDRETGSLWSQMLQRAVTGPLTGAVLAMLPVEHTTWERWRTQHPNTLVLSPDTGFARDYDLDPYRDYVEEGRPIFRRLEDRKAAASGHKVRPMEPVLGVVVGDAQKAYPFSLLKKGPEEFADRLGDTTLVIHFDRRSRTAYVTTQSGQILPSTMVYWFSWQDFFPQTQVLAKQR